MMGFLGFIFILFLLVLFIGISLLGSVLRMFMGWGRRTVSGGQATAGHASAGESSAYGRASDSGDEPHIHRGNRRKIFTADEGEYVDFEEVKS